MLAAPVQLGSLRQFVLTSLLCSFAFSSLLFVEPAPYDLLILSLLFVGLAQSQLAFSTRVQVPVLCLLVFVGSNLTSSFAMQDAARGGFYLAITLYLIASWIFFVGIVSSYGVQALRAIFNGHLIAALVSSACGLLAFTKILPPVYPFLFAERITGLFKDPNVFGPFLIVGMLYALLRLETASGFRARAFWLLLMCFLSLGIFLSFSRAGWLNSAVALGIYLLFSQKFSLRRLASLVLSASLVVALIAAYLAYDPATQLMFAQRLGLQGYDHERFDNQAVALSEASINPLGFGVGQSEVTLTKATHSLYLRVLYENGWLGFLALAGFVSATLFRSLGLIFTTGGVLRKYHLLFFAATVGILANSFFIDILHWRHFWLLLALPWAVYED